MLSAFSKFCLDASFRFCRKIGTLFELVSAYLETTTSHQHWLEHFGRAYCNSKTSATWYHGKGSWLLIIPYIVKKNGVWVGTLGFPSKEKTRASCNFSQGKPKHKSRNTAKKAILFISNKSSKMFTRWKLNITPANLPSQKERIVFQSPFLEAICYSFREGNQTKKNTSHRLPTPNPSTFDPRS